jgi:hypothetical protein
MPSQINRLLSMAELTDRYIRELPIERVGHRTPAAVRTAYSADVAA